MEQLALTLPEEKQPPLWAEFGSGRPMCSWCGARSVKEWRRMRDDGARCPLCRFHPKRER